ncbi:helix-turn-helix domain-containing protein [Achromobacter sp. K91]|uniref:helix-turn-helix transcriptional regulator n=1 Tax=Achromobacter sp. K91 TaxID=2292262 RepID=UPI000E664D8D|nr:helix-turn-helix domain-containing protein [Achromobacter sp. K91]RIJ00248.1 helix-turn-helix domain-containing protein [Achromobacter sp. K91]
MTERDLIDTNKIAELLGGMNPAHVRNRICTREDFPRAFRIGGRKLYDRGEVLEWIEERRQAPDGRRTPSLRQTPSQAA